MMLDEGAHQVRIMEVITGGEAGGAQRHVAELINFLIAEGHEITLVHGGGDWIDTVVNDRVTIVDFPILVREVNVRYDRQALHGLIRLLREMRPDVMHCHSSKAGILGRYAAWRLDVPTVYTAHGYVFQDPTRGRGNRVLFRALEAWAAKRSSAIITMTDDDSAFARRYLAAESVHQIMNGVYPSSWLPAPTHTPPRIGFLGRFSREKGLPLLLDVAAGQSDWQWVIAGDGEMRDLVVSYATRFRHISFVGWAENVDTFFNDIDVLVQPSSKEGAPYTVLDSMARGIPVVGTPVGGMKEMVERVDAALLHPVGDSLAFSRAIHHALCHRDHLQARTQEVQQRYYDLTRQLSRTESVILGVVSS